MKELLPDFCLCSDMLHGTDYFCTKLIYMIMGKPKSSGGFCTKDNILGEVTLVSKSRKEYGAYFGVDSFPLFLGEGCGH
jgi:hypothetical protein